MHVVQTPSDNELSYLPDTFTVSTWAKVAPFYKELISRKISCFANLERWLLDWTELSDTLNEDFCQRFIAHLKHPHDNQKLSRYQYAELMLLPKVIQQEELLEELLISSPYKEKLDKKLFCKYLSEIEAKAKLPKARNKKKIDAAIAYHQGEYQVLFSESVTPSQQKINLSAQVSSINLEEQRSKKADQIFSDILWLRDHLSKEVGDNNYLQYRYRELNRKAYNIDDCKSFRQSINKYVTPIWKNLIKSSHQNGRLINTEFLANYGNTRGLDLGSENKVFETLLRSFEKLSPEFSEPIKALIDKEQISLIDKMSVKVRGLCIGLPKSKVPFVSIEKTNSFRDITTLIHECGHAIHFSLNQEDSYKHLKDIPTEINEYIALCLELISSENWNLWIEDVDQLKTMQYGYQISNLYALLWIISIDEFQEWLYTNPVHSPDERRQIWTDLLINNFGQVYISQNPNLINKWQHQFHLISRPLNYIEYGFAIIAGTIFKESYLEDSNLAIGNLISAMKMGNQFSIAEIFEQSGVPFQFHEQTISRAVNLILSEINTFAG